MLIVLDLACISVAVILPNSPVLFLVLAVWVMGHGLAYLR